MIRSFLLHKYTFPILNATGMAEIPTHGSCKDYTLKTINYADSHLPGWPYFTQLPVSHDQKNRADTQAGNLWEG